MYIEEIPDFDAMADVREHINHVKSCLSSLAQGGDVVQRATDLMVSAEILLKAVKELVLEEDDYQPLDSGYNNS